MFATVLILIGIIVNAIGTFSYVIETIKGNIKPNKITFFVWSIAPFIAYIAQIHKGVGIQSLMTLSVSIFPLSIFIVSFLNKKSHWKIIKQDVFCGLLSIIGLVLWYVTREANVAILFSLFSEFFATLPTIIKSYFYPKTEIAWPWFASFISGFLTLVTIKDFTFANASFAILYTIEMFIVFIFVAIRKK